MGNLIWRQARVEEETSLSRTTIWRLMKAGKFPQKIQLASRAVGWKSEEILRWVKERCEAKSEPVGKHRAKAGGIDTEARG